LCEDDRVAPDCSSSLRPRRVICRSDAISRREELLVCHGLVIAVIAVADDPGSLSPSIGAVVARRFEIEEGLLTIRPLGPARFLLISPDEHTATRIYNDGRPIPIPPGRLRVMRWSRFLESSFSPFPHVVEVKVRGSPAHAWDSDTAVQLLGDCCIPGAPFTQRMLLKVKSSGSVLQS
jgi:hypothetical protein